METLATVDLINVFLHLDKTLEAVIGQYHAWVYLMVFVIIFCETGLVIAPFLPGDSLLFALGTFAAIGSLDLAWLFVILSAAAILGDSTNYTIGKYFGSMILKRQGAWFLKKEHIERTHRFYEKYGAKTIVLARFVPMARTLAPFIAGVGKMTYSRFFFYNVIGGLFWVTLFLFGGYFFGNIPFVKNNFTLVIMAIIAVSLMPGVIGFVRQRLASSSVVPATEKDGKKQKDNL